MGKIKRHYKNWLNEFMRINSEKTESPLNFFLWSGLFAVGSVLRRNVYLQYGHSPIYPNLYVLLLATPGVCRKGAAIKAAKEVLKNTKVNIAKDSCSKEDLIEEIAGLADPLLGENELFTQAALSIISTEFSDLLSVDAKKMISFLISAFDRDEDWSHGLKGMKEDLVIRSPFLSLLAATTPTSLSTEVPEGSFGHGFFARTTIVYGNEKSKRIAIPVVDFDKFNLLSEDLIEIEKIIHGEFKWSELGRERFKEWYEDEVPGHHLVYGDDKIGSYIERMHVIAIRVAMIFSVCYKDELILEEDDIKFAIELVESILPDLSKAFMGQGKDPDAPMMRKILEQVYRQWDNNKGGLSFSKLLQMNRSDISIETLGSIIDRLQLTKSISTTGMGTQRIITWKG